MKPIAILSKFLRYDSMPSLRLFALFLLCSFAPGALALTPSDIPTFRIRFRVISVGGKDPVGHKFPIHLQALTCEADGQDWSPWLAYDSAQVSKSMGLYPNPYLRDWPLVLKASNQRHFGSDPCFG